MLKSVSRLTVGIFLVVQVAYCGISLLCYRAARHPESTFCNFCRCVFCPLFLPCRFRSPQRDPTPVRSSRSAITTTHRNRGAVEQKHMDVLSPVCVGPRHFSKVPWPQRDLLLTRVSHPLAFDVVLYKKMILILLTTTECLLICYFSVSHHAHRFVLEMISGYLEYNSVILL